MKYSLFITICCLTTLTSSCLVSRQDMDVMGERIYRLEEENADLHRRNQAVQKENLRIQKELAEYDKRRSEKEKVLTGNTAGLYEEFTKIRRSIRSLGGRLEETEYLLKKGNKAREESGRSLEKRLSRLEQYLNIEAPIITPGEKPAPRIRPKQRVKPTPVKKKPAPKKRPAPVDTSDEMSDFGDLSDDDMYSFAKQAFDEGDMEAAREGFRVLLEKYPRSRHADNSQFWIGEIYYREKWYDKAVLEYQDVIEKFPKGNKVPAALLKQGFAFYNLGDKDNARKVLRDLMKRFPKTNEAAIAKKKIDSFK